MPRRKSTARDDAAVARFVDAFTTALVDGGMPRMPAAAFATLLATDDGGLTAEQMAERLQASRGGVSGAFTYLDRVGLTARERVPQSRRHRHVLRDPSWYETVVQRERLLDAWTQVSRQGVEALGADTPAGRRVGETLAFFEFLQAEMPLLIERWRAQRGA